MRFYWKWVDVNGNKLFDGDTKITYIQNQDFVFPIENFRPPKYGWYDLQVFLYDDEVGHDNDLLYSLGIFSSPFLPFLSLFIFLPFSPSLLTLPYLSSPPRSIFMSLSTSTPLSVLLPICCNFLK